MSGKSGGTRQIIKTFIKPCDTPGAISQASRANPRVKFNEAARSVNLMIPPRPDCHQSALAGGRWGYGFEQAGTKTGISPGTRQACEEGALAEPFLLTYAAATTGNAPFTQLLTTTPPRTSQVAIVVYDAGT